MRRETRSPKILVSGNLIIPELRVLVLTKRHVGSGNEIEILWQKRPGHTLGLFPTIQSLQRLVSLVVGGWSPRVCRPLYNGNFSGSTFISNLPLILSLAPPLLTSYGDTAFSICAPKLWNDLPLHLRNCAPLVFKSNLKTFLFYLSIRFA